MKLLHNVKLSVFCKPEEDYALIKDAFRSLSGLDLKKEKLTLEEHKAKGFNERIIQSLELTLDRNRHTRFFIQHLNYLLDQNQKKTLISQIPSRLDDEMFFYVRLDKKSWVADKRALLTDSGSCFHIKLSIAAYPKRKDVAAGIVKKVFSQARKSET